MCSVKVRHTVVRHNTLTAQIKVSFAGCLLIITLQNLVSCQVQLGDLCATLNCKIGIWAIHLVKALTI